MLSANKARSVPRSSQDMTMIQHVCCHRVLRNQFCLHLRPVRKSVLRCLPCIHVPSLRLVTVTCRTLRHKIGNQIQMRMMCLREHATFLGRREARRFGRYGHALFPGRHCSAGCTHKVCRAALPGAAFRRAGASALAVCPRHRPRVTLRQQRRQGPREGLPEAARLVRHVRVEPRLVRDGLVPVRVGLRV